MVEEMKFMIGSEFDLLSALDKARQDFAALQALFAAQEAGSNSQIPASDEHTPTKPTIETEIATQFKAVSCQLEIAEQLARQYTGSADVTSKRTANETSQTQNENRYKQIVEEQTDLICRYQSDFRLTFVNEAYAALYQMRPEDLIGKNFFELMAPEDAEKSLVYLTQLSVTNPIATSDHRSLLPDGSVRWIEWTDRVITDANQQIIEYQGVGRDITARRLAEQAAQEQHNFAEALRESLATITSSLDVDTVMQHILEYAAHVVPCDAASITRYENGMGHVAYMWGYSADAQSHFKELNFPIENSQYVRRILSGQSYLITDTDMAPSWINIPETGWIRSCIGVPIMMQNQVMGLLSVDSATPDRYSAIDLEHLEVFAGYAALALKNAYEALTLEVKVAEQTAELTYAKNSVEAILNNSMDGILLAYIDAGIKRTNKTFDTLFSCHETDYQGKPLSALVCDEDKDSVNRTLQLVHSSQRGKTIEVRSIRLDGTIFDAEFGIGFLGAEDDGEVGFVCTIRDISERKVQERELRYYASLQTSISDAVIVSDMNLCILTWNKAAEKIYGWVAQEVIGKYRYEVLPTTISDEQSTSMMNGIFQNGFWSGELLHHHKDGREIHVLATVNLLKDAGGIPFGIVTVNHDITERKERERQLRFSASLQDNVTDAVIATDTNYTIQSWNGAAERIYGWSADEAIGQNSGKLFKTQFGPGETLESFQHQLRTSGTWQSEVVQIRKDGTEVQILSSINVFRDENGIPLGVVGVNHDITERKERERQLRFSANLQENVVEAVIATDLNFNIQSWNRAAESIYGWRAEEILGKSVALLRTEFSSGEIMERVKRDYFENGYWTNEVIQYGKAGLPIHILSSVVLLKDENGKSMGSVAVNHDITARKQADEALQVKIENELEFQIYLKALHEISIELTQIDQLDEFYRRVVELGREHLGFDRLALFLYDKQTGEAIGTYGTSTEGSLTDEHSVRFAPNPTGVMMRTFQHAERFCFDDDVELHHALNPIGRGWNASAAVWDGTTSIGWLVADNFIHKQPASKALMDTLALYAMTVGTLLARKQTDAALRESEIRYRLLAENMSDVILHLNPVGDLLYVSPSSLAMLGYNPEEMVGRSGLEFVNPDDLSELVVRMNHATDGTIAPDSVAFRFQHKQGHLIWLEATGKLIISPQTNELLEFVASVRDISARKRAEEAIKQALEKEKELGELKSRFVSMTSHEFRTPLANILATTETLSTYRQKMTDEQIEQRFNNIRGQVDHLKDIIEDVLQFTRIDLQYVEYHPQPLDLDALCREILGEFESRTDVPNHFVYNAQDVPSSMNLDKKLMRQIINNLISNAVKYSPADKPVGLSLVCKDELCILTVADEGIGIPEADLKHMFVPFHRAGNVGTVSGTGLGMIITRKAVELHGGTIAVQSKVGVGTTIIVEIPIVT